MTDKFTYPESHIGEIRAAIENNDEKAAADAALFLLAAFLHDVRRIADALESSAHTGIAVMELVKNRQ